MIIFGSWLQIVFSIDVDFYNILIIWFLKVTLYCFTNSLSPEEQRAHNSRHKQTKLQENRTHSSFAIAVREYRLAVNVGFLL